MRDPRAIEVLGYDVGSEVLYKGASDIQVNSCYSSAGDDPRKYLTKNQKYIVSKIRIEEWSSSISLEGFEDKQFNSVCFEKE